MTGVISHQLARPTSKNLWIINAGEGVGKREPSYTADRRIYGNMWRRIYGSRWRFFNKLKIDFPWMLNYFSHVPLCATPWTVACQSPLSLGFSRQEYWNGLPWPPPWDLLDPGIEATSLMSPALEGVLSTSSVIRFLDIYPEKNMAQKDTCTPMFIAALFTIAKAWKQPRCISKNEWIWKKWYKYTMEYSVQYSFSVMSNSLWPHRLQYARLPCPSSTPRVCSGSYPSSRWCHLTMSSSVIHSPPAFNLSQPQGFFQWVSFLHQMAKVLELQLHISPSNEDSGLISFRIYCFDLLAVQGTLKSLIQRQFKSISSLALSFLYGPTLTSTHYWKTIALTRWNLVSQVMSLLITQL